MIARSRSEFTKTGTYHRNATLKVDVPDSGSLFQSDQHLRFLAERREVTHIDFIHCSVSIEHFQQRRLLSGKAEKFSAVDVMSVLKQFMSVLFGRDYRHAVAIVGTTYFRFSP